MNRADRLLLALWKEFSEMTGSRPHRISTKVEIQREWAEMVKDGKIPPGLKPREQQAWLAQNAWFEMNIQSRKVPKGSGAAMLALRDYLVRCGFVDQDGAILKEE